MVKVKIYVEGGGDSNYLRTRCRAGFSKFLERAGFAGRMPAIVACGGRNEAYDNFCTALQNAGPNDLPLLLVDSEDLVAQTPWKHLQTRDNWPQPEAARDEHAHFMAQCMEAWFLADRQSLMSFFGQGFAEGKLPNRPNVEAVPKKQVFETLKMATRASRKGEYGKAAHSFQILEQLNPALVRMAAPHLERLLTTLDDLHKSA